MENQIDKKLLISYFSGNATTDQKQQIALWLDSNPEHQDIFYQHLEAWEREHQEVDFNNDEDFENLTARIFSADQAQQQPAKSDAAIKSVAGRQSLQNSPVWKKLYLNQWQKIAAMVMAFISIGTLFFIWSENRYNNYMACSKIKKIMLPDSSIVILNTHSEIRYLSGWKDEEPREVWLEGEAFFSVRQTAGRQRFIVHTTDQANVEVLGTQFTVSHRSSRTRVVLNTGEIRLQVKNNAAVSGIKNIQMKPGDLVEFAKSARKLTRKTVNPAVYSSWKDNRLIFDNSTFHELKMLLEERFELKVVVKDTILTDIRFNGDFPSDNPQLLFKALAATYNLEITTRPKEIYLESRSASN